MPTPQPGQPYAAAVASYAAELDARYPGQGYGAAYEAFAEAHPSLSATAAGDAWALSLGLAGLGQGLSAGVGAVGTAQGQIAQGAGQGAIQVYKSVPLASFLGELTNRAFIIRALKVIIGAALVITGIAQISGVSKLKVIPV